MIVETVNLTGKTLFLTKNPHLIRKQIEEGVLPSLNHSELIDAISTDSIIPNKACISSRTTEELGEGLLTGLPGDVIRKGDIKNGGFEAIVGGKSFGRGSSREHAQLALLGAGINFIAAESFERIFQDNCRNYGILTMNGKHEEFSRRLLNREVIPLGLFLEDLNSLNQEIIRYGGLLSYTKARLEKRAMFVTESTSSRPMTLAEKIIARHIGIDFIKPGQSGFVSIDKGYGYELQMHVCIEALKKVFGSEIIIKDPDKFFFFEDHLALLENNPSSEFFRKIQYDLAERSGARVYRCDPQEGVEGICHSIMLERHCLPSQLIVGNDSHTGTLGAVGALAIGKGASELASSFLTSDIPLTVPETLRFNLHGRLRTGIMAKDVILHILALPQLRDQLLGSGKVFEYAGPGLNTLSFDEQVVLTNMAIEGNAFTGIIEPNEQTFNFLVRTLGIPRESLVKMALKSDTNAEFDEMFSINLNSIESMVALPGDPQRGVPLSLLRDTTIPIDIAYIGSCTGGSLEDLKRTADLLDGREVSSSVRLYVQANSKTVERTAQTLGIWDNLEKSGIIRLKQGCGACMNAGPGASENEDQITISNTNRNFYGRMGKGQTYLASTDVVVASAIKGKICSPLDL